MKQLLQLVLLLNFLLFFSFAVNAQVTPRDNCASCNNCTMLIDSVVNTQVTVPEGKTLCIGPKGQLNGVLEVKKNASACNKGIIKGNIYLRQSAKLCNDSVVDVDSLHMEHLAGVTNGRYPHLSAFMRIAKDIKGMKTEYFYNEGCLHFKGNVKTIGLCCTTWGGKIFIDGNWHPKEPNMDETITIDGYLEVKDTLKLDGRTTLKVMPGRCIKAGYIDLKTTFLNRGDIIGVGPGYAQLVILNEALHSGTMGRYLGMLDVCIKSAPGTKPPAFDIDPTVTFCKNNLACNESRCEASACAMTASVTVTSPDCLGNPYGTIVASASGGQGTYTYSWSSGQTTAKIDNVPPGSYTLTITDAANCTTKAEAYVKPSVAAPLIQRNGNVLQVTPADTSLYFYFWYLNGNPIAGAKGPVYSPTAPGEYKVYVAEKVAQGQETPCSGISMPYYYTPSSVRINTEKTLDVNIFPNPSDGVFSVFFNMEQKKEMNINVINIVGEQVISIKKTMSAQAEEKIDISNYSSGLYFLEVRDEEGNRSVLKIINR